MAKNNINTSSSNNSLQGKLDLLKSQVYSSLDSTTNDYGDIITNLPTMDDYDKKYSLQSEDGIDTKLGIKDDDENSSLKEYATTTVGAAIGSSFGPLGTIAGATIGNILSKIDKKDVLDPVFATAEGWLDNDIKISQGSMLLNNRLKEGLEFQKDFLNTQKEMIQIRTKLN